MSLRIDEFDYALPKGLIAQNPEEERTSSRLLVLKRDQSPLEHRHFGDIRDYIRAGDVLVLNNTRVLPARISALKPTGGRVDILMVEKVGPTTWLCLVNGLKRGTVDQGLTVGSTSVRMRRTTDAWEIDFPSESDMIKTIKEHGRMPLPPYIRRGENGAASSDDFDRYQTVYAARPGSIAAPTAGLHFSRDLLDGLQKQGVVVVYITLHIGIGTFFLIKKDLVEDHEMHREWYHLDPPVAEAVRNARGNGGRVIAVGTSAVRTLETYFGREGHSAEGYTDLFIYPGYRFKVVDMLLTNFHLPRSTPLVLASAFAGRDNLLAAYQVAIEKGYRFYSYGDAMLIQ